MDFKTNNRLRNTGEYLRQNKKTLVNDIRSIINTAFVESENVHNLNKCCGRVDDTSFRGFIEAVTNNIDVSICTSVYGDAFQVRVTHRGRKCKDDLINKLSTMMVSMSLRNSKLAFIQECLKCDYDLVYVLQMNRDMAEQNRRWALISGNRNSNRHWFGKLIESTTGKIADVFQMEGNNE